MNILKPVYKTAMAKTEVCTGKNLRRRLSKLPAVVKGPSGELWANFNNIR